VTRPLPIGNRRYSRLGNLRYEASATGSGNVLLTYADDTPAMATVNHGLGTFLAMNFSVSEFSSNLARQRIFPAWMQEIVKNLDSEEPQPASSTIGETVTSEVWKQELNSFPVMKPSANKSPDSGSFRCQQ